MPVWYIDFITCYNNLSCSNLIILWCNFPLDSQIHLRIPNSKCKCSQWGVAGIQWMWKSQESKKTPFKIQFCLHKSALFSWHCRHRVPEICQELQVAQSNRGTSFSAWVVIGAREDPFLWHIKSNSSHFRPKFSFMHPFATELSENCHWIKCECDQAPGTLLEPKERQTFPSKSDNPRQ